MSAFVTINPTTQKPIARYELMTDFEMSQAVESCHKVFESWKLTPVEDRAKIIGKIGDELGTEKITGPKS